MRKECDWHYSVAPILIHHWWQRKWKYISVKIGIFKDKKFDFYPPPVVEGDFSRARILSGIWRPASRFLVGAKT